MSANWAARQLRKFATSIKVIRLFRNWPIVFLIYFGLWRHKQRSFRLRNGSRFIVASGSDWPTILEIWWSRVYTPSGREIKSGSTVVDIGAHVGIFSILAATRSDDIRVISYEPHPNNFKLLTKNIKLNNLKKIEPFQLAVAGASGKRKLFLSPESLGHSLVHPQGNYLEVDCITLEEVLGQVGKCDFLKMDCEGAEFEILFNTPVTCLNKIGQISLECYNPPNFTRDRTRFNVYDLKTYLQQAGFKVALEELRNKPYTYLYAVRQP